MKDDHSKKYHHMMEQVSNICFNLFKTFVRKNFELIKNIQQYEIN